VLKGFLNGLLLTAVLVAGVSIALDRGWLPGMAGAPEVADTAPDSWPADLQLVVLNGTGAQGLARNMGMLLARSGLAPVRYGNASAQDYARSILVNRRMPDERAIAVARRLGVPLLEEYDGRSTEDAVLVLGGDHASLRERLVRMGY